VVGAFIIPQAGKKRLFDADSPQVHQTGRLKHIDGDSLQLRRRRGHDRRNEFVAGKIHAVQHGFGKIVADELGVLRAKAFERRPGQGGVRKIHMIERHAVQMGGVPVRVPQVGVRKRRRFQHRADHVNPHAFAGYEPASLEKRPLKPTVGYIAGPEFHVDEPGLFKIAVPKDTALKHAAPQVQLVEIHALACLPAASDPRDGCILRQKFPRIRGKGIDWFQV